MDLRYFFDASFFNQYVICIIFIITANNHCIIIPWVHKLQFFPTSFAAYSNKTENLFYSSFQKIFKFSNFQICAFQDAAFQKRKRERERKRNLLSIADLLSASSIDSFSFFMETTNFYSNFQKIFLDTKTRSEVFIKVKVPQPFFQLAVS